MSSIVGIIALDFHCGAIPMILNLADFGNKTQWDSRHVSCQTDQAVLVIQMNYVGLVRSNVELILAYFFCLSHFWNRLSSI